ncbi:serpin family protein [Endozoicomonas acroporae]|uniref:serpin family protein n=1 Tax=Endozoicomonas acroporae TaxID=1701104 RepID=UPI000C77BCBB|nr:serpin family protein [Endozoicomonas acroporae]
MNNLPSSDYPRVPSNTIWDNSDLPLPQSSTQSADSPDSGTSVTNNVQPYLKGLVDDVQEFVRELTLLERSINIVTSPALVTTSEAIATNLRYMADSIGDTGEPYQAGDIGELHQARPLIKSTEEGIHVFSKRPKIDGILRQSQIPHTTSEAFFHKGPEQATAELNEQITKDTQGLITDFLQAKDLENPDLAFQLVTWLLQQVSWQSPFRVMNEKESSEITWENAAHSEIQWMESGSIQPIKHIKNKDYDFVAVPVLESGMKAVFVLPPEGETNPGSEDLNQILSSGLTTILGKSGREHAVLTLPKFKFNYQFTKICAEAEAKGKHMAALDVDENGATVAAASSMLSYDLHIPPEKLLRFKFDHSFYLAIINHKNSNDPRVIGMAQINHPEKS